MEEMVSRPQAAFWRGKRVLLTGHTGFKGAWLALWLQRLGAEPIGLSLAPATEPSLYQLLDLGHRMDSHLGDIRDADRVQRVVAAAQPDIVLHLAAQALVRPSYAAPLDTFSSNVMGTAHVLEAVRQAASCRVVLAVTTDKVYRNREWPYPYREDDALGGHDPYSASKAAAEMVIASYRDAYLAAQGVAVGAARAGNVIGGGDWAAERLIPDALRAWSADQVLEVRRPEAIRPWQHVLEPLSAYLCLAERLWAEPGLAGAYNFGPPTSEAATVRQVVLQARQAFGRGEVHFAEQAQGPHEAGWLALEVAKARTVLGLRSRWGLAESVRHTLDWYRRQLQGEAALALCEEDIAAYEAMP